MFMDQWEDSLSVVLNLADGIISAGLVNWRRLYSRRLYIFVSTPEL